MLLEGRRILLGVCGGISAYKACELVRMLIREGASVQVVMTPNATKFVSPLTFTALSGTTTRCDEFGSRNHVDAGSVYDHLDLSRDIDCMAIVSATANTIAKLASGHADNLLTGAYLSNIAPLVIAPAMNVRMWDHPATVINIDKLKVRGAAIVEPVAGTLACGDSGTGRLADLEGIFAAIVENATQPANSSVDDPLPLAGRRITVTAGGTREYIDPVRFITNSSTGTLAFETARLLISQGAQVELVHTGIDIPPDLDGLLSNSHRALTAFDMLGHLSKTIGQADGLVMLAAIADYSPANYESAKRSKDGAGWKLDLIETTDVLATLARSRKPGQVMVGVSLEDSDWINGGMKKAEKKNVDVILAVELGGDLPFGNSNLNCALVSGNRIIAREARRSKPEAAGLITGWIGQQLASK